MVQFDEERLKALMQNKDIVRNKLKVEGTVKNAKAFIAIQKEFGSFDAYIWQFPAHKTLDAMRQLRGEVPSTSKESDAMSKELKKRGFTFVGSTICYAYMQAAGMVNDHTVACFRHKEIAEKVA